MPNRVKEHASNPDFTPGHACKPHKRGAHVTLQPRLHRLDFITTGESSHRFTETPPEQRFRPTEFFLFTWTRCNGELHRVYPKNSSRATEVNIFTPIASFSGERPKTDRFPTRSEAKSPPSHHRNTEKLLP
ncbi:hypothetical protein Rs2_23749 [Raphanus sativus]|nr:hypothetical protein Rs2_23749 [Raphanus sativus]